MSGFELALGKTKPVIADKLGVQLSSVVDVTKVIYQNSPTFTIPPS